jgi:hypothetical protein
MIDNQFLFIAIFVFGLLVVGLALTILEFYSMNKKNK